MSIGQIIVLTAVVGAFVLFAAVLGWGDYYARQQVQQVRRIRDRDRKEAALAAPAMKKAAEGAVAASRTAQARWPQPTDDEVHHWVT